MHPKRLSALTAAFLFAALAAASGAEPSGGESPPPPEATAAPAPGEYRTPLAGKPYRTTLFGRPVEVPPFDRDNIRAIAAGATFYKPNVGDDWFIPMAGLYFKSRREPYHLRAIVSLFVNEVDVVRSFGNWELLGRWENETVPTPSVEIADGAVVRDSSIFWGTLSGSVGAGLRYPVPPFESDNDLRLQLFYQAGYLYSRPSDDTGPTVQLPPDTFLHGIKLRGRYDGMQRNVMELLHDGVAAGFDVDLVRRNQWGDANYGGSLFRGEDTRDYAKLSAYLTVARKVPWLTERDRLIVSVHGGYSPGSTLDRFSAFRIGGGLFPNEADDIRRPYYPGALFNNFPLTDFALTNFEYRRELLFFLYFHLRGTLILGKRPDFHAEGFKFLKDRGEAFSTGITCGLPMKSQLYLEYAYDEEVLRDDRQGSSFLLLWSKAF